MSEQSTIRLNEASIWQVLNKHGIQRNPKGPWVFMDGRQVHITGQGKAACEAALKSERIPYVYVPEDETIVIS
jgi:hypothetical protein